MCVNRPITRLDLPGRITQDEEEERMLHVIGKGAYMQYRFP